MFVSGGKCAHRQLLLEHLYDPPILFIINRINRDRYECIRKQAFSF